MIDFVKDLILVSRLILQNEHLEFIELKKAEQNISFALIDINKDSDFLFQEYVRLVFASSRLISHNFLEKLI